jgi:site-specific recombinase XerD
MIRASERPRRSCCPPNTEETGLVHRRLVTTSFRHTKAKEIEANHGNDLMSLAHILGHENLQTTSQPVNQQLAEAAERLRF